MVMVVMMMGVMAHAVVALHIVHRVAIPRWRWWRRRRVTMEFASHLIVPIVVRKVGILLVLFGLDFQLDVHHFVHHLITVAVLNGSARRVRVFVGHETETSRLFSLFVYVDFGRYEIAKWLE